MAEETKAKYASEAFEFLRLFQRVGHTVTGLLFLEIGWILLLILAGKLAGEAPAPAFPVLWLTGHKFPFLGVVDKPLSRICLAGGLVILVVWIIYTRLYQYLSRPVGLVVKPILTVLLIAATLLAGVLNLLLWPVFWLVERWMLGRSMRRHKQEWLQKNTEAGKREGKELEAAYQKWTAAFDKEHPKATLRQMMLEKVSVRQFSLVDWAATLSRKLLTHFYSHARIGLAPLISTSYTEDLQAAKAPLQVFATAIARLTARMGDIEALDYIQFYVLPPHFKIMANRQAAIASRLLGLDGLLWGSYAGADGQTVWLNMYRRARRIQPTRKEDEYGSLYQARLFPARLDVDVPSVTLGQQDHRDGYIALLAAVIQIMQDRKVRRQDSWLNEFDRLYWASSKAIDKILRHLVFEAFRLFPEVPAAAEAGDAIPTARAQLIDIIGSWVGHQLSGKIYRSGDDLWATTGFKRFAQQLDSVIEKCTKLAPNDPAHQYRLGSIACLLGDKHRALRAFREAGKLEAQAGFIGTIGATVAAGMTLDEADRGGILEEKLALARFAAHAACAISTGDEYAVKDIREQLKKSTVVILRTETPVAISIVEELLENAEKHLAPAPGHNK